MVAFVVLQFYFYIQLTWYAYWNKMYYNIVYITVNSEKKNINAKILLFNTLLKYVYIMVAFVILRLYLFMFIEISILIGRNTINYVKHKSQK